MLNLEILVRRQQKFIFAVHNFVFAHGKLKSVVLQKGGAVNQVQILQAEVLDLTQTKLFHPKLPMQDKRAVKKLNNVKQERSEESGRAKRLTAEIHRE